MSKKILILGGSYLQSFFIEEAINMNLEVHVLDMNASCFVNDWKNIIFKSINIVDIDAVENYFLSNKCDLIVSPATELGNLTASIIANKHGLLYNSVDTIGLTTDKQKMRQALKNTPFKEPKTTHYHVDVNDVIQQIGLPFMIKPKGSSAGRGVTLVSNPEEYDSAIQQVERFIDTKDDILIESFLGGKQYSVETITANGQHHIVAITEEILSGEPYFLERMHFITPSIHELLYNKLKGFITKLLTVLNIKVGPCHIEIKVDGDAIHIIEAASRSGGLRDRLIYYANEKSSYNRLIINAYLGETLNIDDIKFPIKNAYCGIITHPEDFKSYLDLKKLGLVTHDYFNGAGLSINPQDLTATVGYVFAVAEDMELLNKNKFKL